MEAVFFQKVESIDKKYKYSFSKILIKINIIVSKNGCELKGVLEECRGKTLVDSRREVQVNFGKGLGRPPVGHRDLIFRLRDISSFMEPHVEPTEPSTGLPLNIPETLVSASSKQNKHDVPKISSLDSEEQASVESLRNVEINRNPSQGMVETYRRFSQSGENIHVTQSRSIFSHEDKFVYGNPKEDIKNLETQTTKDYPEIATTLFERNSSNALDLSCKAGKPEDKPFKDGNTYQNYQKDVLGSEARSIPDNKSTSKKPSLPEQLHIAKMQQQQRRSMHHQQKFLQQVRRDLDAKYSNRQENTQTNQKSIKYHGNIATNHEHNESDNQPRSKEEFGPQNFSRPFFDTGRSKELPDNHPILPLLDPVYFSALYNAHGFLPPSSPTIAAAFIGTLQDTLPKLPNLFPSTSSNPPPLFAQKTNQNQN